MKEDKTLHGAQQHTDNDRTDMECTNPATQRIPLHANGKDATMHLAEYTMPQAEPAQQQPETPNYEEPNNGTIFVLGGK